MNIQTVRDILDQFDNRAQMIFILPVDPGNTNKLSIPKQIRKRKSDNDISVTKYDSNTEDSSMIE